MTRRSCRARRIAASGDLVSGLFLAYCDFECERARFFDLRCDFWVGWEGIPQGLKPFSWLGIERPKAEALGYLEGQRQSSGKCNGESKGNDKQDPSTDSG